jgi:hypothetical protein
MSRSPRFLLAAAAIAAFGPGSAQAYDGGLVRIEPRPYYGAVVTMEQGVRVYRPLPTQNLMIINPNRTPVSLSFSRTIEHKAAEGGGGHGQSSSQESEGGSRYGGISGGFGNYTGTSPQANGNRGAGGGIGVGRPHTGNGGKHAH